ncbi:hypothetical protein BUZ56_07505 [Staphylococcus hyicus]|uniref:hypothetical protein n=1 Tax=Staphylococcus hyicus TaxID=1284 RepID=UPI000D1E9F87|nr:hypothetical protein [Staphylococcus hyicus]NJH82523.1 hypothetical protein [Staphylococcus hyicus]PTJ88180.1 hypothetical protein BUZ56_07505 [Staphylococcus hyicus]
MTKQEIDELLEGITENTKFKTLLVEYTRTKYSLTAREQYFDMSINSLIDRYSLSDCFEIRVYLIAEAKSILIYEDGEMVE